MRLTVPAHIIYWCMKYNCFRRWLIVSRLTLLMAMYIRLPSLVCPPTYINATFISLNFVIKLLNSFADCFSSTTCYRAFSVI